ncbi:hypothetical protein ACFLZC_00335 [Patescibacteria group bacterium]
MLEIIVGLVLWCVLLFFGTVNGGISINEVEIENPIARFFCTLVMIVVFGFIFWGLGWFMELFGKILVSPIMYFF